MSINCTQVIPYLTAEGASDAIAWYEKVFGAKEIQRMTDENTGKLMHGHIQIDGLDIMVSDDWPEAGVQGPKALGGTPVSIYLSVGDCDTVFKAAIEAGAVSIQEPNDSFWGERFAMFADPFGHKWSLSHKQRDMTDEEMQAGAKAWSEENA